MGWRVGLAIAGHTAETPQGVTACSLPSLAGELRELVETAFDSRQVRTGRSPPGPSLSRRCPFIVIQEMELYTYTLEAGRRAADRRV
jgi:hypothetical protein